MFVKFDKFKALNTFQKVMLVKILVENKVLLE